MGGDRASRREQARRSELLTCFQSGEYDVLHYAGHAFFDPEHRLFGASAGLWVIQFGQCRYLDPPMAGYVS